MCTCVDMCVHVTCQRARSHTSTETFLQPNESSRPGLFFSASAVTIQGICVGRLLWREGWCESARPRRNARGNVNFSHELDRALFIFLTRPALQRRFLFSVCSRGAVSAPKQEKRISYVALHVGVQENVRHGECECVQPGDLRRRKAVKSAAYTKRNAWAAGRVAAGDA